MQNEHQLIFMTPQARNVIYYGLKSLVNEIDRMNETSYKRYLTPGVVEFQQKIKHEAQHLIAIIEVIAKSTNETISLIKYFN